MQIAELQTQRIQVFDGILSVSTMIPPHLLYRTACLPLSREWLLELSSFIGQFVLNLNWCARAGY